MEEPWQNLFSYMEMEHGDFFNQPRRNSFDDEDLVVREFLQQSAFSSESESHSPPSQNNSAATVDGGTTIDSSLSLGNTGTGTAFINNKRGKPPTRSSSFNSIVSQHAPEKHATDASRTSYILSFGDSTVVAGAREAPKHPNRCEQAGSGGARSSKGANQTTTKKARNSSESQGHIMAERKRRQELSERFIALSATIPGLKKIDKASILGEAITYFKQLQERLKELEERSSKKIKEQSVSFINKAHLHSDEGTASCETNSDDCYRLNILLPEVEARVLEKQILIRIHCKKQNGVMLKILTQLASFDLSIVSNSVLPFGNSALAITIIAQIGDKYNITVKDLVKGLRLALSESSAVQLSAMRESQTSPQLLV